MGRAPPLLVLPLELVAPLAEYRWEAWDEAEFPIMAQRPLESSSCVECHPREAQGARVAEPKQSSGGLGARWVGRD